jgi:hypothetical protein
MQVRRASDGAQSYLLVDDNHLLQTNASGGGGGSNRAFVYLPFKAVNTGTGYTANDLIEQVEEFNTATSPSTYVDTLWRNLTKETTLSGAPLAADIVPVSATATSVSVSNAALTIIDAFQAPVVTNWTSATSANTAVSMTTAGYDLVNVTINPPAGLTGGSISFQVYDGAGWIPVKAARTDSYLTDSTFQLSGSPGFKAWQVPVSGFPQFRVILGNAIVGSGTTVVTTIVSSAPDVSIVTVGLDPQSPLPAGTNALGSVITTNGYTPSAAFFGAGTITAATGLGTITAAANDYTAVLANSNASYLAINNQHASANMWVNPLGAAYASGVYLGQKIPPGGTYVWDARVPVTAIHIASDTTGATFFAQVA